MKTGVKTPSGRDQGVYDGTPIAIRESDQKENRAKALDESDSGRWSFTSGDVTVYVLIIVVVIIVVIIAVIIVVVVVAGMF